MQISKDQDWIHLMKILNSMMLDIDPLIIQEANNRINVNAKGRINKATKNLLVNGGRGLHVNPNITESAKLVANYIKEANPTNTTIFANAHNFDEILNEIPIEYKLTMLDDSVDIDYDSFNSEKRDFIVIFDAFYPRINMEFLSRETFSVLFCSKSYFKFDYVYNIYPSIYKNVIWNREQQKCIQRIAKITEMSDFAAPDKLIHSRLIKIIKKELKEARIIV